MDHRFANDNDLDFLAEWNFMLIQDEGHRNPMTVTQLRERMKGFIAKEYKAVIFTNGGEAVAYALYRENEEEVCLRQLFVSRDKRRQGIGREAVEIMRKQIWPRDKRLTVEVLTKNKSAIPFWRSVGYKDYCLTLEIMPGS